MDVYYKLAEDLDNRLELVDKYGLDPKLIVRALDAIGVIDYDVLKEVYLYPEED